MFSPTATSLLALLFSAHAFADLAEYTVWSSVVFTRTGDRTPIELLSNVPTLTELGAAQAYQVGAYMRSRYMGAQTNNGIGTAPLVGISLEDINVDQVYIGSPGSQFAAATAQAFLQGFYPPTNATTTLANGTQISSPLGNYQYPLVQTYSSNDPESVYLNAANNCPAFNLAITNYELSDEALRTEKATEDLYKSIGSAFLQGVLPEEDWSYAFAWPIWDYINYQNTHFVNVSSRLSEPEFRDPATNVSYLEQLRWLSDKQLDGLYANIDAVNDITNAPFSAGYGSISTIAGNFLASQILGQLQQAVKFKAEWYKLNLLFGDFQPLLSLFELLQLPLLNTHFSGMPEFASTAVFELFSYTDGAANPPFPDERDLFVRFYWRNGTDAAATYQYYSLFNLGPDMSDLTWSEFQSLMYELVPGSNGNWCTDCGADASQSIFCAYYNASQSLTAGDLGPHHAVAPAVAGVIGALVALALVVLVLAAVMLFGGLRFHRVYGRKSSEVGGYKGSQKLASDKDLVIPKGGAAVVVEREADGPGSPVRGGHERVGSWELKQNEANLPNIAAPAYTNDDVHDIGEAPWQKPVEPHERV